MLKDLTIIIIGTITAIIMLIKACEAQPLAQKARELGNYQLLEALVDDDHEARRQVKIAVLLTQQYVESSFDPDARSSAGALGITQILPQNLKSILDLHQIPKEIPMDLAIYAQVKHFEDLYRINYFKLKEIGKKIGIKPRLHHLINMYLIQYIGGYHGFSGKETYTRVLRGVRHTEPQKRSRHHQPYAVNLYVTKHLSAYGVLSPSKVRLPREVGFQQATRLLTRINNVGQMLSALGYDMEHMKKVMMEEI